MGNLLLSGLLIGMRHPLEADHVAAIASLASRKQSLTLLFPPKLREGCWKTSICGVILILSHCGEWLSTHYFLG